jgi:hypothetical protein
MNAATLIAYRYAGAALARGVAFPEAVTAETDGLESADVETRCAYMTLLDAWGEYAWSVETAQRAEVAS